ncbi:MAG: hypothetical protein AAF724_12725 [Pseudomonadota bacterium]
MTRKISGFLEIDGLEGIYTARSGKLNCFAIPLRHGGLCLYSPISGMSGAAREQLMSRGGVKVLFAPNHYHNKGLQEHADAFPDASLVCSKVAETRLRKVTGLNFSPLDTLHVQLADGYEVLEPEGLKTGEVWVRIKGSEAAWIVTDAFSAKLLAPGVYAETATQLGTFPKYGVEDPQRFKRWTLGLLESSAPTRLLPCHGSPVAAPDLGNQLAGLLDKLF